MFNLLENKRFQMGRSGKFSYSVKMRYAEVIDEDITDLLALPQDKFGDPVQVNFNEWEGYSLSKCNWVTLSNSSQLSEVFLTGKMRRDNSSGEFGKTSSKSSGVLILEAIQTFESNETRETAVVVSRISIFDLPGSEILLEDPESVKMKQGKTLNRSIITVSNVLKDLATGKSDFVYYEASVISSLMRDCLGGNSLGIGIFNIQNGDLKATSLALNFVKFARKVINFPIINDNKSLGLLKILRSEIIISSKGKAFGDERGSQRVVDLEKKLIEDNLDKLRTAEDRQRLGQKLAELREKYNQLVKSKSELQGELIRCEEEKLEISKSLVELQIENTRLLEVIQNEKFDLNNKLISAEGDVMALNMKEEQALSKVSELQERLKEMAEEKRELEIEFVALKKNFIEVNGLLDDERRKNENLGVELINVVNENKALHDEINDIYKRSGSTNEENARFIAKIEKIEKENQEFKEALIFSKAECERLKTEMVKYDILEKQHNQEYEAKKIQLERGLIDTNKEQELHYSKLNREADSLLQRTKNEKLQWESEKMEHIHKIKLYQRNIAELEDRINELTKINEEVISENTKMNLQIDEMRSIFRSKLLDLMGNTSNINQSGIRASYEMNAREELIRSYNEKEIDLNERIERERIISKNLRMELKAIRSYARNIRYLAEDWAPVGIPLPEILVKTPPIRLDDEDASLEHKMLEDENDKLRRRIRNLEEDKNRTSDNIMKVTGGNKEINIQQRLTNEIEFLKGRPDILERPGSSTLEIEQIRKERNELQEENRNLVNLLKDNRKWDIYLMQKENERLVTIVKEFESGNSAGPTSGETKNLRQRLEYYEKSVRTLEKERSELIVRSTMAEEQLKHLQDHLNKVTFDYQRKLNELKKSAIRL